MKKLFTLLALTISFSMNAQLVSVTEEIIMDKDYLDQMLPITEI